MSQQSAKMGGALEGLRVLDLSSAIAMPFCALTMADMGAEVIRIESHTRINDRVWGALLTGLFPENEPSGEYWEESANFHLLHRSKLGITLDLKRPEAVEILKQLVAVSDIVIENNRPGVLERLGVGYDVLREAKPDLIMLANTGFGRTGPWSHYPGLASMLEPLTGLAFAAGYEDDQPARIGNAYIDYLSAWTGFVAVMAAVHHRRKTGEGQFIDLSMFQVGMHTVAEPLLDYQLNDVPARRLGNRHRWMAPHNVYPCLGNDRWVAIAVRDDAEWQSLCSLMGQPEWCQSEEFEDAVGRHRNSGELDGYLADWTIDWEAGELMRTLQEHGIPAGVVQDSRDLHHDPQLWDRGYWEIVDHTSAPRVGARPIQALPYRFSETDPYVRKPSPRLGEDNRDVLQRLLKLDPDEIDVLEENGVISSSPAPGQDRGRPDVLDIEQQLDVGIIRSYDPDYRMPVESRIGSSESSVPSPAREGSLAHED